MDFGIAGVAAITVIAYIIGLVVKASTLADKWIPIICGLTGGVLGIVEDVAGGGVNGHRAGVAGGIGLLLADVELQGFKFIVRHDSTSFLF